MGPLVDLLEDIAPNQSDLSRDDTASDFWACCLLGFCDFPQPEDADYLNPFTSHSCVEGNLASFSAGVIIFYSVQFLPIKNNKIDFFWKKTKIEPKPSQTDRFRFGSWFQKTKKTYTLIFFLELASSLFTNIVFPALCKLQTTKSQKSTPLISIKK